MSENSLEKDNLEKAKSLLLSIGEIDDLFLEEAESADIASFEATRTAARKRIVRYSTLAATASIGIAVTCFVLRLRTGNTGNKLMKSA